jgi:hypothetical protein
MAKYPYDLTHYRRKTVAVRVKEEYAALLKVHAAKRHKTHSKMLDTIFQFGLMWVEKQDEWQVKYPTLSFNDDVDGIYQILKAVKKYEIEDLMGNRSLMKDENAENPP